MYVLVVDDQPEIRLLVERALSNAGHQTMSAADASEAMQLLVAHPEEFTCLISDVHMGIGPSGSELIDMARDVCPSLPCILITGQPDDIDSTWRTERDVGLIAKPFKSAHLANAVRERVFA